jgi:hypothetical protein
VRDEHAAWLCALRKRPPSLVAPSLTLRRVTGEQMEEEGLGSAVCGQIGIASAPRVALASGFSCPGPQTPDLASENLEKSRCAHSAADAHRDHAELGAAAFAFDQDVTAHAGA